MSDSKYIGISEHRLNHTIAVARKCYNLAKSEYEMSEAEARKMFLMGFLHDIGYEFAEDSEEHPNIASEILDSFSQQEFKDMMFAIQTHGKPYKFLGLPEQAILNEADLTINHLGESVSMEERCKDIRQRYGEQSHQYYNSINMVEMLNDLKARNNAQ